MSIIKDALNPDDKKQELPEIEKDQPLRESDLPTTQIIPAEESAEEMDPWHRRQIIDGILQEEQLEKKGNEGGKRGRYNNLPS